MSIGRGLSLVCFYIMPMDVVMVHGLLRRQFGGKEISGSQKVQSSCHAHKFLRRHETNPIDIWHNDTQRDESKNTHSMKRLSIMTFRITTIDKIQCITTKIIMSLWHDDTKHCGT
jgi:hypothetical protein